MTDRLLALARDSSLPLAATILSGFLTGLLTIWQALSISRVVDGVFLGGQYSGDVAAILRLLIFIIFLRALLSWLGEVSANTLAVQVKTNLRRRLFDKLLRLGPAYTRGERTGELVNIVNEGIEALDAYFSQYLPQLAIAALVPLSILVAVFPHDPLSGVVLLLTAPLIPVFMYLIGKTAETLTKRQWNTLNHLSAHFLDSLQGLTTLKELGRSKEQAQSIAESSAHFRDVTLNVLRVTFLSSLVLELVATVSTAIVAVEVSLRLLYGHLDFQSALFLLFLAPEFYIPLRMLGLRYHAGMAGTSAAKRIYEILDTEEAREESGEAIVDSVPQDTKLLFSKIRFTNLSYTYPGDTRPALQDVNLEIRAGEHVALVGHTGAGKSTLAALLMGFMRPDLGRLTVDNKPVNVLPLVVWRKQIAWVPQNPHLFHDTISANLRLAKPEATEVELTGAARAACLDEFIHTLPAGYETVIGEEGTRLSGGQAQRLALARGFLKDAPILIMDEPTSGLDPENEALLVESAHRLMEGRTVLTIAHRLNTVYRADRIFVLKNGRLVESGTHRELVAMGGVYSDLIKVSEQTANIANDLTPLPPPLKAPIPEEGEHDPMRFQMPLSANSFPGEEQAGSLQFSNPSPVWGSVRSEELSTSPSKIHVLSIIGRLLSFLRGSWGWVALSVLLGVLTVGSNVGLMSTSAYLISAAALHPELGALQVAIVGVRFFGITRGIFRYGERLTSHSVTFRLLAQLRTWFYRALEPLAPARLMQYRSGDLLARIVADVETLENFYVRVVSPPMVALVVAAGMIAFFVHFEARLAIAYLAFLIVLEVGLPVLFWTLSQRAGRELVLQRAGLQSRLVDGIQGLADLLVFGREHSYLESLTACGRDYNKTQRKLASLTGFSSALTVLLVNLGMLAVLVISIPLVTEGKIPGAMLATLTLAALAGFEAVMPLPQTAQMLSSSLAAGRRLFEVVENNKEVKVFGKDKKIESGEQSEGWLETPAVFSFLSVSGLTFTYPGSPSPALLDVSFELRPGKRIAIVGPSGAGKSTLVNLLLGFWDSSQGKILLNGRNLREFDPEEARRLFSVISQRAYFFNESLRNNLRLARPKASETVIRSAAKQAQIDEFIMGLPNGYETIVGERALRLSGGERQRLAIARALLKDAPIFLLDEPTANLDPLTERRVLDSLFELTRLRSLLLVTHRLVGLENMDEIIILERGRIVQRGLQADLLACDGLYRRMWEIQNRIIEKNISQTACGSLGCVL